MNNTFAVWVKNILVKHLDTDRYKKPISLNLCPPVSVQFSQSCFFGSICILLYVFVYFLGCLQHCSSEGPEGPSGFLERLSFEMKKGYKETMLQLLLSPAHIFVSDNYQVKKTHHICRCTDDICIYKSEDRICIKAGFKTNTCLSFATGIQINKKGMIIPLTTGLCWPLY